jgi:mono/diheme cytochrome c family protein
MNRTTTTSLVFCALSSLISCGELLVPTSGKDSTTIRDQTATIIQAPPEAAVETDTVPQELSPRSYHADAKALLEKYCVSCHGGEPSNNAPAEFTLGIYEDIGQLKGAFSSASRIKVRIEDGTMPPKSADLPLPEEDKAILVEWINGGALKGVAPEEIKQLRPTLQFINPPEAGVVVGDSFQIQIALTDAVPGATWTLYYSDIKGANSDGRLIVENIPATQTAFTWDTSGIAQGTYYLYAVLSNKSKSITFPAKGPVEVTRAPKVTLTSHQGNQIFKNQTGSGTISWTMINSRDLTVHYQLEYSSNGGETYLAIPGAEDLVNTLTFTGWNITNTTDYAEGTGYKLRVSAIDKSNVNPRIISFSESPNRFGITDRVLNYYGDIYPIFLGRGCLACHGNGKVNVGNFAGDEYDFPSVGAFQSQNPLVSDALLGINGTMRIKASNFTNADFDLVKLWKWDGAAGGVYNSLNLLSHKGSTVFQRSVSPSVISWDFPNPPANLNKYAVHIFRNGTEIVNFQNGAGKTFSWDISALPDDHRYKVKVTALSVADVEIKSVESTTNFAVADHVYTYFGDVVPKLTMLGCGSCHNAGAALAAYDINLPTEANLANLATRTSPGTGNMPAALGLSENDWMAIRIWDTGGRANPKFGFVTPATNQFFTTASTISTSWSATNPVAGITYALAYKKRDGTVQPIVSGLTVTSYNATSALAAAPEGYYRLILTAKDAAANVLGEIFSNEFYLSPSGPTYANGIVPLLNEIGCGGCHGASGGYSVGNRASLTSDQKLVDVTGPSGTMPSAGGVGAASFALINEWKLRGDYIPTLAFAAPAPETFSNFSGNIGASWTVSAVKPGVTYTLEYRKKGAVSYLPLASGITLLTQTWDTSAMTTDQEGYYQLRLTATNAAAESIAQKESGQFYLSLAGPTYQYGVQPLLSGIGCGCHGGVPRGTKTDMQIYTATGPMGNMPGGGGIGAAAYILVDKWKLAGFKN